MSSSQIAVSMAAKIGEGEAWRPWLNSDLDVFDGRETQTGQSERIENELFSFSLSLSLFVQ